MSPDARPLHYVVTRNGMEFKEDIDPVHFVNIAYTAQQIHKLLDSSQLPIAEQYTALAMILKKIGYHLQVNETSLEVVFTDGYGIELPK